MGLDCWLGLNHDKCEPEHQNNPLPPHHHHRLYRLVVWQRFGGPDGSVQAGFAQVNIPRLRVGGQELQEHPRVQVVVIIQVAEPAGADRKTQEVCSKEGAFCSQGSPQGSPASPQAAGQEGVELRSHLAGQGQVAVLGRAVGEDHMATCQRRESSEPAHFARSQGGHQGRREGVCSQTVSSRPLKRHPSPW